MSLTPSSPPAVIDALAWVHVHEGRLLCVRTEGVDLFYLPGGKREPGESDEAAVAREAREEVSVILRPGTFRRIAVIDEVAHAQVPGARVRLSCHTAEHDGEIAVDNEIAELAWIGFADRERCAPAVRRLVELLHAEGTVH
ncbi:8-oxo-dGTP pyrophosphatase MutT (NUDIX family) [Nocardiopsis arvandica]|uniref:8-oxo-dGTP pyrophosphatase MutT (NUDIX family) n=1 Tax=Nocardiopsis sinuspersici TaxID=501010 RepID=A0A7Y9XAV0_9ACTN|nr:NUDIX domain-containing protein [Nocardiopsis sinuspersici]NYH52169.1 8-oxo-dGTP pyrophosphatase MutT (NUDIX family) [Nocardiopsis sinuspersici]